MEEYSLGNGDDTFSKWVEFNTKELGDIRGSVAYKHGIFKNSKEKNPSSGDSQYITDGTYSWRRKYGSTRNEAFENVKNRLFRLLNFLLNLRKLIK